MRNCIAKCVVALAREAHFS